MTCRRCHLDLPRSHNRRGCNFPPSGVQFPDRPPNGIPIVVADWEKGEWNVIEFGLDGDITHRTESNRTGLLDGRLWGEREVLLIVESAHTSPRSNPPQNKSQIFSRDELEELDESLDRTRSRLIAFPQSLTKQARAFSGIPDRLKDECDPWAILVFYLYFSDEFNEYRPVSFSNWSIPTNREIALRILSKAVREDMSFRLNVFRSINTYEGSLPDYDTSMLPVDEVRQALNIVARIREQQILSQEALDYFDLGPGDLLERLYGNDRAIRLMSLYVCVFNADGAIRTHHTMMDGIPQHNIERFELFEEVAFPLAASDEPIGLKFIWERLLRMHPYRGRSSGAGQMTARANLMWKGLLFFDQHSLEGDNYLLKRCVKCDSEPGDGCVNSNGLPTNIHAKRRMVSWDEPEELWALRRANRRRWRGIQKEMLRAMIEIGRANLEQANV